MNQDIQINDDTKTSMPVFLNISQIAMRLGVSEQTAKKTCAAHGVRQIRLNSNPNAKTTSATVRYYESDVLLMLASLTEPTLANGERHPGTGPKAGTAAEKDPATQF